MPSGKRKFETTAATWSGYASSSSASESRVAYRSQPDSEDDDLSDSSRRSGKRPKLSTPVSAGKVRRPAGVVNTGLDGIDFLAHPDTPEPTPTKTPRAKGAKTPRTGKKATTSGLVIIQGSRSSVPSASTARALASSPSKPQKHIPSPALVQQAGFDPDRTPRPAPSQRTSFSSHPSGDELEEHVPLTSVSSRVVGTLRPAVPGAARGRKKVPGRQLSRGDSLADAPTSKSHPGVARNTAITTPNQEPSYIADSDEEVPIQSRVFPNKGSPTKPHSTARKALSSPQKRTLANGDSYVEYMVPMASGDDDGARGGLSSGDEGAYISASASEDNAAGNIRGPGSQSRSSKGKGRARSGSRSIASPSKGASRSSSVSRRGSPSNYASSAYTSRASSPSPAFLHSEGGAHSSDSESDSGDSLYEHQHHVDPLRNLEKLASLARMALTAAEDMRKKGVMREGEPPLPKSFLTGVMIESGKQRTKRSDASPSKKSTRATESGTEAEDGEEIAIIKALPERRLGQVSEEPVVRSRSWMDTVLSGPSGPTQTLSSQTSISSITSDTDNPFDNRTFKRTSSQPSLGVANTVRRPDLATSLPAVQSEPSLETVLAAYDMTPSRARTMHINMTPSKNRIFGTPSRARLFGTPSRTGRTKELDDVIEDHAPSQEFDNWLNSQQTLVLKALRNPPWAAPTNPPAESEPLKLAEKTTGVWIEGDRDETEAVVKLRALLRRTVETGEGNSCLLVGPRGSGKTRTVMSALRTLIRPLRWEPSASTASPTFVPQTPTEQTGKAKSGSSRTQQRPQSPDRRPPAPPTSPKPIVIHLSGYAQTNDRLAMREIARQLVMQSGEALDISLGEEEDDDGPTGVSVPTATHLPQIVGALARQARPTVVVLDAFDLFAEHARQALLYCLLDTVQSCRAGEGSRGLAVVGITSRIDCITMLEKRVKSRFSHRIIRISPPVSLDSYTSLVRATMAVAETSDVSRIQTTPKKGVHHDGNASKTWCLKWKDAVDRVLSDRQFKQVLEDAFELSRDVRLLLRILSGAVTSLTPSSPWLTVGVIARSIQAQCAPSPFAFIQELAYPCVALLIATQHTHDRGHDTFTFKMLCAEIKRELGNEAVTKALVQMQGRGLGLIRVPDPVLEAAFESLVAHKVLVLAGPSSHSTGRAFLKYRCVPERSDIKEAVDRLGHSALKRWFVQGASN
ncbi:origin recognition complex subunit 4 [Ceratobasidium sp. AG-Ba]|nr:origin recognition complex subunit 4 [Ceratobasidium sp. AG-Ba]